MPFIAFEGLDGSGKSTLLSLLKEELALRGKTFVESREPGGTPLAEQIRALLLKKDTEIPHPHCELLLYLAARAQHVEVKLRPAVENGSWVICDRFFASTVAFQSAARGIDLEQIKLFNSFAVSGLWPDLNVLLDLTVQESVQRQSVRGQIKDRMESEDRHFHEAVRESYLKQSTETPERWLVLDAKLPPQELFKQLRERLAKWW